MLSVNTKPAPQKSAKMRGGSGGSCRDVPKTEHGMWNTVIRMKTEVQALEEKDYQNELKQMSVSELLGALSILGRDCTPKELVSLVIKQRAEKQAEKAREREDGKRKEEERLRREKEEGERNACAAQDETCMDLPLEWDNVFNSDARTQGVHTDSIPDALVLSLNALGRVDIEYISSVTGEDYKTVICTLKGSIYQNPDTWNECFYQGWETAEEYLSGNLMRKWNAARKANETYPGRFTDNLRAIEKVMPQPLAAEDIYITLGSPWVPPDIIDDFMEHLFGDPFRYYYHVTDAVREAFKTRHDEITGTWEIPEKSRYCHSIAVRKTYGTNCIEALHILEKTLNMKPVVVTDEVDCPANASGKKRVINKAETVAALEKQQLLIKTFQHWVWTDKARKERLEIIFENNFGCVRKRNFDGSFLTLPGLSPAVQLYPYQKDAVARIIFTPNTLLAHDVGAGKTYVMVAAGQELRRMGLSKKNLYVVPNNIVGQWRSIFLTMYPNANLLCVEPRTFTPSKRKAVLKKIRDNDYDGIIMAYSCFEQIPLSKDYYLRELQSKRAQVRDAVRQINKATSGLRRQREKLDKEFSKMALSPDDCRDIICFDELGVTRLFVDEAHNFKNVPVETKTKNILGINRAGSKKCQEMMDKVHLVQKMNDGKGVVLATGTPITNSVTDVFIMQKYLQSGELGMLDLQSFDSWIGMFAEKVTEFEIDVDTSSYRLATRFAKFHNLPELTALLASVADFHQVDDSAGIPEFDGYNDARISRTDAFSDYLKSISERADNVRNRRVSKTEDNMLKITTDGRKAALDMRLVDPNAQFTYRSKAARCAENVADIYFRTAAQRSTQIIFCDSSTPKAGFNLYDELKRLLVMLRVPREQIAYIHDADTEARRARLFARMRSGEIRVLIGSTFRLGLGVNVQERLIAIHHIDVPWRPADMTQREGRILRQGNTNQKVYIFRYITEGSFDAYSWQLLETKQRFIAALLSGSLTERCASDIEDTVLDYAEVKALAIGNPLVKERVEAANELNRYRTLQRKLVDTRIRLEKELMELPGQIDHQITAIDLCKEDLAFCDTWKAENPPAEDSKDRKEEAEKRRQLRETIGEALRENILTLQEKTLMNYRGFELVLPANMTPEKPFVWLKRRGKYYVELGGTDVGNLIRIDNFLDTLDEHLEKLEQNLAKLRGKEQDIRAELAKDESYADAIEACRKRVEELDEKLGVQKQ